MSPARIIISFLALSAHSAFGTIFAITGHLNPGLVTFDEASLQQTGGNHQNVISDHDLAFDRSGRLFVISSGFIREFDPTSLQIINEQARSFFLSGIAVGNDAIYSLTGSSLPALVSFDRDSLLQTGGTVQPTISFPQDLAFDNHGRLFGLSQDFLLEFNPATLGIINQQPRSDFLSGIGARDGVVYSLTGSNVPGLISFDADTLRQTGGTIQNSISGGQDLAFDMSGRLFGSSRDFLLELDPATLQILNQVSRPDLQSGLTVGVPELNSSILLFPGVLLLFFRRSRSCEKIL